MVRLRVVADGCRMVMPVSGTVRGILRGRPLMGAMVMPTRGMILLRGCLMRVRSVMLGR